MRIVGDDTKKLENEAHTKITTPFAVHLRKMYIHLRQQLKLYGKYTFISTSMNFINANEISITLFACVLTFNSINGWTISLFGQSNITKILSISRNGWSLTPIENQLHSMTINCVLETFNNTICIETYIQLHLHTIVYSKWSIINVNWQTCV